MYMAQISTILLVLFTFLFVENVNGICEEVLRTGVDQNDVDFILNKHNKLRLDIMAGEVLDQPKGENLKLLKWDTNLARAAQESVRTCDFTKAMYRDPRWSQNSHYLAVTSNTGLPIWRRTITEWVREKQNYVFGQEITNNVRSYTQLVWADTESIGCGYIAYRTRNEADLVKRLYVCYYGPAGNVGRIPYMQIEGGNKIDDLFRFKPNAKS